MILVGSRWRWDLGEVGLKKGEGGRVANGEGVKAGKEEGRMEERLRQCVVILWFQQCGGGRDHGHGRLSGCWTWLKERVELLSLRAYDTLER